MQSWLRVFEFLPVGYGGEGRGMSIKLIKDTILQNIIFSKFEGLLFSNQLINRLHYITQNSMAFRVFPADRTARFIHSTGVMHLASEIFRNGLSNTDHTILKKFI